MSKMKTQEEELLTGMKAPPANAFKPGHPRYGGRKKGSPVRRTAEAREIAEHLGFHPIELLAHIALKGTIPNADGTETPVDTDKRLDAIKAAAPYLLPRLSAQTLSGPNDGPVEILTPEAEAGLQAILADPDLAKAAQDLALKLADIAGAEYRAERGLPAPTISLDHPDYLR